MALAGAALAQAPRFGWVHRTLPLGRDLPNAIAFGDVDGDGDYDAFLAVGTGGSVAVGGLLYANEHGVFTDMTSMWLPAIAHSVDDVALGDVDGDGDLDAWLQGTPSFFLPNNAKLLLNDGAGRFVDVTAARLPAGAAGSKIALGDVDGDGDLDALAGSPKLYLNDGSGTFTEVTATHLPQPLVPLLGGSPALGDVDGDGDLDALFVEFRGRARLYRNDGAGAFSNVTTTHLPALMNDSRDVALDDVDRDGDLDAWLANAGQDRLYVNDGSGVFQLAATAIPLESETTIGVALGDVDGDGDLDALAGTTAPFLGVRQNRLYLNDGTGRFVDATATSLPAVALQTGSVALGDVDGDADLDAVLGVGTLSGFRDRLYLNDGAGMFTDVTDGTLPPSQLVTTTAQGDVDGDRDVDVFVGTGGQDLLFLNHGNGVFADATATHLPVHVGGSWSLALADVDADGDLDALIGRGGSLPSARDRLYLNDGNGVFIDVTAGRLPANADDKNAIAFADVDSDADLDAVLAYGVGLASGVLLYLNDGTGTFTDATAGRVPSCSCLTMAVVPADVDRDGDVDLVASQRLYLNDGSGVFTDVTATRMPPFFATSLAVGDVDGDADLDILAGGGERLFLNDGTGVFVDVTATHLPPTTCCNSYVVLGDADGDGDLDAAVAGTQVPSTRLWLNYGNGVFIDATSTHLPAESNAATLAVVDLDGDADLDALLLRSSPLVLTNLTRQLAWRSVPAVGKPLTMDVYGAPGALWVLHAAARTARIPLPFGTWRLDPSTSVVAGGGVLDVRGRAAMRFMVPANPSLIGMSAAWQALVTNPLATTNLEITTLTGL